MTALPTLLAACLRVVHVLVLVVTNPKNQDNNNNNNKWAVVVPTHVNQKTLSTFRMSVMQPLNPCIKS